MPNIFFFDIDDTLFDHRQKCVPASAIEAITGLKQAGHTIVIATGRSPAHAQPVVGLLDPDYLIAQNGTRILRDGNELSSISLEREALIALFDWVAAQGHGFGVSTGCEGYVSSLRPEVVEVLTHVGLRVQTDNPVHLKQPVAQAWLFFDESLDATLVPTILDRFPEFALVRWHKTAVDVLPRAINKWTGCQWVLDATGYRAEQAIAFGDGLNDLQMLQGAGLGIAMGNAHPDLKAAADHIAPDLDKDGIAIMLDELTRFLHPVPLIA